jgi:hypothetical protein
MVERLHKVLATCARDTCKMAGSDKEFSRASTLRRSGLIGENAHSVG